MVTDHTCKTVEDLLTPLSAVFNEVAVFGADVTKVTIDPSAMPHMMKHIGWSRVENQFLWWGAPTEVTAIESVATVEDSRGQTFTIRLESPDALL
jgi:hypothetical protein